jgi:hypothetical protein
MPLLIDQKGGTERFMVKKNETQIKFIQTKNVINKAKKVALAMDLLI